MVGIAKGSFYNFDQIQRKCFSSRFGRTFTPRFRGVADHALSEANGLPPSAACGKGGSCRLPAAVHTGDMVFIENDAELRFCRDCRMMSKMSITTMTLRRRLLCSWKNMALFRNGGSHSPRDSTRTDSDRLTQGANRRDCTRRCGNAGTALAGSYLNKRKGPRAAAFPRRKGERHLTVRLRTPIR